MLTRAITGFFFLVVMVGCIIWNEYSFAGLILLINTLAIFEVNKLVKDRIPNFSTGVFFAANTANVVLSLINMLVFEDVLFLAYITMVIYIFVILYDLFSENFNFSNAIVYLTFSAFVSGSFIFLSLIVIYFKTFSGHYPYEIILGFFIILWCNDTFAYLTGKFFGKNKLWEKVSPKKTWEGFFGGFVFSLIAGKILSIYFDFHGMITLIDWLIIAALISIFGTLGDLTESMIKRKLEIKDSGNLLPGHGGILDRFDGVFLAAPIVTAYLLICLFV